MGASALLGGLQLSFSSAEVIAVIWEGVFAAKALTVHTEKVTFSSELLVSNLENRRPQLDRRCFHT